MTGNDLKALREKYRVTQFELAVGTGIPLGTIGRWESKNSEISKAKHLDVIRSFLSSLTNNEDTGSHIKTDEIVPHYEHIITSDYSVEKINLLTKENILLKEQLLEYQAKEIEELKKKLAEKERDSNPEQRNAG